MNRPIRHKQNINFNDFDQFEPSDEELELIEYEYIRYKTYKII